MKKILQMPLHLVNSPMEDPDGRKNAQTVDFLVDGVAYFVRVKPFKFNDENRYYISVNDGPDHLFIWDDQMRQIRSLDDDAAILPDGLERAISDKLISAHLESDLVDI